SARPGGRHVRARRRLARSCRLRRSDQAGLPRSRARRGRRRLRAGPRRLRAAEDRRGRGSPYLRAARRARPARAGAGAGGSAGTGAGGMKLVDEYRDAGAARRLLDAIARTVTRPWVIMEVCGGQTHALVKYGIDQALPAGLELVHGPGCPVCVTPIETID